MIEKEEMLKKFEYLLQEGKGILVVIKEGKSIHLDERGMYSGSRIAREAIRQGVVEEVKETQLYDAESDQTVQKIVLILNSENK